MDKEQDPLYCSFYGNRLVFQVKETLYICIKCARQIIFLFEFITTVNQQPNVDIHNPLLKTNHGPATFSADLVITMAMLSFGGDFKAENISQGKSIRHLHQNNMYTSGQISFTATKFHWMIIQGKQLGNELKRPTSPLYI